MCDLVDMMILSTCLSPEILRIWVTDIRWKKMRPVCGITEGPPPLLTWYVVLMDEVVQHTMLFCDSTNSVGLWLTPLFTAAQPLVSSWGTLRTFSAWPSLPTTARSCLAPVTKPSSCGTPWECASTPFRRTATLNGCPVLGSRLTLPIPSLFPVAGTNLSRWAFSWVSWWNKRFRCQVLIGLAKLLRDCLETLLSRSFYRLMNRNLLITFLNLR